jgi:plasmid stabilization system protein ParE
VALYSVADEARRDLEAIADYIMEDNPLRAVSFVQEITARFASIGERPLSFPHPDDLPAEMRSALHGNYRIIFRVTEGVPEILRVLHGARDLPPLLRDLKP